jgi:ATP-dependent DNA ligase
MTGGELAGRGRRARQKITSEGGRERHGESSLPDLPSAKARFIEPMKAKLVEEPPATGDWIYELKFDGIRLIPCGNPARRCGRN